MKKLMWSATAREVVAPAILNPFALATTSAQQKAARTGVLHSLAQLYPDVTVDEQHSDSLTVTDHPVEKGQGNAYIQDHAFKLPAEVVLTYGFSPANSAGFYISSSATFLNDVYQKLLAIQSSRGLFSVKTLRRNYDNMVLQSISLTTDVSTANVLMVRLTCKEILFAKTESTPVSIVALAPTAADQANPQADQTTTSQGQKQPLPAPLANQNDLDYYRTEGFNKN